MRYLTYISIVGDESKRFQGKSMVRTSPTEMLKILRSTVRDIIEFEQDSRDMAEFKSALLLQIAEIEAMGNLNETAAAKVPVLTDFSPLHQLMAPVSEEP